MGLELDFECLAKELRFADLYSSFPLLTDGEFAGCVQTLQQNELLKPVL